jgi:hypothetical protein
MTFDADSATESIWPLTWESQLSDWVNEKNIWSRGAQFFSGVPEDFESMSVVLRHTNYLSFLVRFKDNEFLTFCQNFRITHAENSYPITSHELKLY